MNRILQLFTLLLTLFVTTSCDEKIEAVHYVSAGSFTNVEVIDARTGAKTELPPRTEVESYSYYEGNLVQGNFGDWITTNISYIKSISTIINANIPSIGATMAKSIERQPPRKPTNLKKPGLHYPEPYLPV